jgi:hypothetical protein
MSKTLLEQLRAAREALAAALAASTAGNKQLAKVERDRDGVAAQLERLEIATKRDPEDASAVARLSTLRDQKRLMDQKLDRMQTEDLHDGKTRRVALADALSDAVGLLIEAGKPTLDRLTEKATAALAPFYQPGAKLELAAQRCDAALNLRAFLVNAGHGAELDKPTRALRLLDTLIAGEPLPWIWPGLAPAPATAAAAPAQAPQPTTAAASRATRKLQSAMP